VSVNIIEPRPQSTQSIPVSFRSRGPQVSDFFTLTSEHTRFDMKHDGENNFIVWLLDSNGTKVEQIAGEVGTFDGSRAIDIQINGIYCLNIGADVLKIVVLRTHNAFTYKLETYNIVFIF
jgi:hypothetical protein